MPPRGAGVHPVLLARARVPHRQVPARAGGRDQARRLRVDGGVGRPLARRHRHARRGRGRARHDRRRGLAGMAARSSRASCRRSRARGRPGSSATCCRCSSWSSPPTSWRSCRRPGRRDEVRRPQPRAVGRLRDEARPVTRGPRPRSPAASPACRSSAATSSRTNAPVARCASWRASSAARRADPDPRPVPGLVPGVDGDEDDRLPGRLAEHRRRHGAALRGGGRGAIALRPHAVPGTPAPREQVLDALGRFADRAAAIDLRLHIEVIPTSMSPDLASGWDMVQGVGARTSASSSTRSTSAAAARRRRSCRPSPGTASSTSSSATPRASRAWPTTSRRP